MSELKVEKINLGTSASSESPNAAIHITRDNNTSTIVIEENIDGTAGGNIDFWKTRNGAASVTDDFLGVIKWYDDKGETGVALLAVKTDTGGAGSGKMFFKTKEAADSSYTTRMMIKEDGKVGIGTASPPGLLSVDGTTTAGVPGIHLTGFGSSELDIAVEEGEALHIGSWDSSADDTTLKFIITDSGNVGIGGHTNPGSLLTIKAPDDSTDRYDGIHFQTTKNSSVNDWYIYPKYGSAGGDSNVNLQFNHDSNDAGYLDDNATQSKLNFTGQHRCIPSDSTLFSQLSEKTGLIVISSGNYNNPETDELVTINDSIPTVLLSVSRNQKTAFGVISSEEDKDEDRVYSHGIYHTISQRKNKDDVRMYINSLGEGAIWVSNINGDLENGDYITTCEIPGHGMKQDDDLLHNYTVAKITQDCTFDLAAENYTCEEIEHDGQTYKRAFVGCTYHCG